MDKLIIYKVTCLANNKIYIGKTSTTLPLRMAKHLCSAKKKTNNCAFHSAIRKYGKGNFVWEIIDRVMFAESLVALERHYIEHFNCKAPNGYNLTNGGEGMIGYRPSKETLKKMSAAQKGKHFWPNGTHPMLGTHLSDSTKAKLRKVNLGRKLSLDTRKKMSELWHEHHPEMPPWSVARREKMKELRKDKKHTNFGRHWSLSDEVKEKYCIAQQKRRAKERMEVIQ